ncbi:MAG: hypothetical protein IJW60_01020 [Clostridia bacterium]|nr:hypothetical protein [Clostridia bacterium]
MKKKLANLLLALIACLFAAFGFIACGENPLAVSAPTNVRINANTMAVEWDSVNGAAKYTLSINDGTEYTTQSASYPCSQLVSQQQTFTVKVCAVSSVGDMKSEPIMVTFTPLAKVADLTLSEEGSLTWSVVAGATGYAIRVDGVEQQVPLTVTDYPITMTSKHSYQVRPVVAGDNSYYSIWSDVKEITKLGTVDASKIKYDVEQGKLSWSSVSGAEAYEVYVNGFVEAENCKATSMDLDSPNANFTVEIKAKSSKSNILAGEMSEGKEFIFLDPVTNIKVENGVLVWDEVELASGYILKIGTKKYNVTETSYDKLARGTTLNVSIMPVSEDAVYFSNWSQPTSFYLLQAPVIQWNSSLMLDDGSAKNNIYWDAIDNAYGYELRIIKPNGDESIETAGAIDRQFAYDFLEVGTYTVELKAVADPDDSTFCDSPYSAAIKVQRLASPTALSSGFITSIPQELSKGFTVSFEKVAKATGYRLYKEETAIMNTTSSTSQFKVTDVAEAGVTSEKSYNYFIQSIGTDSMQNNTVVLSSLQSKSLPFVITVLATPQNTTIKEFSYEFGSIDKAHGYAVSTGSALNDCNDTKYDLGVVLPAGVAEIKVCAKGDGAAVLASNFSTPITVYRLEAPRNIRIDESGSDSVLKCADVANAKSYNVVFDNNSQAIDVDSIENIRSRITTVGTSVHMIAVNNNFGVDGTYYMTSRSSETVTFVKLETPTFGTQPFSNTQLSWNKPGNINERIYSPTYAVYNENGVKYTEELTGTSMNIANIDGGKEYTFKIKALGDASPSGNTHYISSDVSESKAIWKLASPEVKIVNNQYQWTAVGYASSYALYIGEDIVYTDGQVANKTYTYKPSFDQLTTYRVEVVAIGDLSQTINSKAVEGKNLIQQQTKQLQTPDFELSYSHTSVNDEGVLTVTITTESPYAMGYTYKIGGVGEFKNATTYTKQNLPTGTHKVAVFAQGGGFDENGVYYLNSKDQGGSSTPKYMITLLAAPTAEDMEYIDGGIFKFEPVGNAEYGYTVEICVNGGAWQTVSTNAGTTVEVSSYITGATNVKFRVTANGYGDNVIASKTIETKTWNVG